MFIFPAEYLSYEKTFAFGNGIIFLHAGNAGSAIKKDNGQKKGEDGRI